MLLVREDLEASRDDALGTPPPELVPETGAESPLRSLAHADWHLRGPVERSGTTDSNGRILLSPLPEGRYVLLVRKTLRGNLVEFEVPLVVGDDGAANFVVEIGRGSVRSRNVYRSGGEEFEEISGPDGSRARRKAGRLEEITSSGRTFSDTDGDGLFLPRFCDSPPWLCDDERQCGDDRVCSCSASCPWCEDCGPEVCVPPELPFPPYRCSADGGCELPGDVCACVPSCEACDDCALSLCVPSCEPVELVDLRIAGPDRLAVGRETSLRAIGQLDDGTELDVTYLVDWSSSDPSVASVDGWGVVRALREGQVEIRAALDDGLVAAHPLEVVPGPDVVRVVVELLCFPVPLAGRPAPPDVASLPPEFLPPPCHRTVRVGGELRFFARAELADGTTEDVTERAQWEVEPPDLGEVEAGVFRGLREGTGFVRASFRGVRSDPSEEIRVVAHPRVVELSIAPADRGFPVPILDAAPVWCFSCPFELAILVGDEVPFVATALYETGEWEDVTEAAEWESSDPEVAPISPGGVLAATAPGRTTVEATFAEVRSNPVEVRVVAEASVTDLSIHQEGSDRAIAKGDRAYFRATALYDVGFPRDVTEAATWRSEDPSVGDFEEPGVFVGRGAGTTRVWAEFGGFASQRLPIEVFEESTIELCDPRNPNRAEWSDAFNRVVLESDCAVYTPPDVATFRFTVTERERPGGIFDPCLDLYVYRGNEKIRTIREEGCGEPFLPPAAPEFEDARLRYQLLAFWDLKDDRGNTVPPGRYTVWGRFYLYFDPVVALDVLVTGPDGRVPCEENACGNGCGYVHACGDSGPPSGCPTVCVPLCECPPGWGITEEGDCEPCVGECCPPGALCGPRDVPPCEPECCPPNARCTPEVPPCEPPPSPSPPCCPPGALCGPLDLPPCEPEAR
ncbi:MAG: hypothetical protein KatS3mg076_2459 [Candidatus Binatia bacterium]|nr:MAG: hypothetical protein KatS3mg076_2459 [Candidatus Binatia bacterium]